MWNTALVFRYGRPVAGREAKALETFTDANMFFGKLAADGKCAEPEFLQYPFGGGMMILRAKTFEDLQTILEYDEVRKLMAAASLTSTEFRYDFMVGGEVLMDGMANWTAVGTQMGYF